MKFTVKFTEGCKLQYNLVNHDIVNTWASQITNHTIDDLCKNNHYVGYASKSLVQSKIDRLNYLADTINGRVPNRVIKQPIGFDNYNHALSIMHVHFPELKNDSNYQDIWDILTEYNDIIHWLEATLPLLDQSIFFRITLDFNKSKTAFIPIPESAYKLFTSECCFGDLLLHYTHVGKNANEMFMTKDYVCPKDQFVPQRTFNASVRLHFFNNFHDTEESKNKLQQLWIDFYNKRGGKDYWGYDIDDPMLAFGFMRIGSLSSITLNDNDYEIPKTIDELNYFRDKLVNTEVISWNVE